MDTWTLIALLLIGFGLGGMLRAVVVARRERKRLRGHNFAYAMPKADGGFHIDCGCAEWHVDVDTIEAGAEAHRKHRASELLKQRKHRASELLKQLTGDDRG